MTIQTGNIEVTNFQTIGETGREFISFSTDSMSTSYYDDSTDFVSLPRITRVIRCSYCGVLSEEIGTCPHCGAPL